MGVIFISGNSSTKRARILRKNMTDAEQKLWSHLRYKQLGGYRFRRQQPIGDYIVDFICLGKKLIIEIDGGQHNNESAYENKRTEFLESQGYTILRFWNNDVLKNIDGVVKVVGKELGLEV